MTVADDSDMNTWSNLQDRLRESVVSINISMATPFEFDNTTSGFATGFVVDAEQGIILSNRHVMGPGPSYHKATFFNNQEVHLQPTYYDPEHDFAFFRYDPAEVEGVVPRAIKLAPGKARSGLEIRVVGNNSNEKMTVLQGELSQLDRNVPDYVERYNDLNTFYYQASTSSKGGSSGSPVVDIEGDAVALNAGSNNWSSNSFFLPLQRVQYAFEFVQRREIPPRGTLQAVFTHISHQDAEKHGLSSKMAASEGVDVGGTTGLLMVSKVLLEGPADKRLHVGDIVICANNAPMPGFVELFEVIDRSVGCRVQLRVFSKGRISTVDVTVQDLYSITPTKLLRIGDAYLHNLSFQQCMRWSAAVQGVLVCLDRNGFLASSKIGECTVIRAVNNTPTPDIDALMDALMDVRRGEQIVFQMQDHRYQRNQAVVVSSCPLVGPPNQVYTRSSSTGFWSIAPYPGLAAPLAAKQPSRPLDLQAMAAVLTAVNGTSGDTYAAIQQNFVQIDAAAICPADGAYYRGRGGSGLVIDPRRGLILCGLHLVANPTCNLTVMFGGMVQIRATHAYTHPLYPVAFLKYQPEQLDPSLVSLATIDLTQSHSRLRCGSSVALLTSASETNDEPATCHKATVLSRDLMSTKSCKCCFSRRFYNTEYFSLTPGPRRSGYDLGVVCDAETGHIGGVWLHLPDCLYGHVMDLPIAGLDISLLLPTIEHLQRADTIPDTVHVLDVEFGYEPLATARALGVSDAHIRDMLRDKARVRGVLKVNTILQVRDPGVETLEIGDIILKVNGRTIQHIDDVASFRQRANVELALVRRGEVLTVNIPALPLQGTNTRHVVYWAGIHLQEPYQPVLQQTTRAVSNVFNFTAFHSGPANCETFHSKTFISEIADESVKTLDDVMRIARGLNDPKLGAFGQMVADNERCASGKMPGRDVSLRLTRLNGEEIVKTIRTNDMYYPTWQLIRGPRIDDDWVWKAL